MPSQVREPLKERELDSSMLTVPVIRPVTSSQLHPASFGFLSHRKSKTEEVNKHIDNHIELL